MTEKSQLALTMSGKLYTNVEVVIGRGPGPFFENSKSFIQHFTVGTGLIFARFNFIPHLIVVNIDLRM